MTTERQMTFTNIQADAGKHLCPSCQSGLLRTWRRPVDRFTSQFVPVHRYRCRSFSCQWEGSFRAHREVNHVDPPDTAAALLAAARGVVPPPRVHPRAVPKSFVVHMALAVVGVAFVVVITATDWLPVGTEARADSHDANWLASARPSGEGTRVEIDARAAPGTPRAATAPAVK